MSMQLPSQSGLLAMSLLGTQGGGHLCKGRRAEACLRGEGPCEIQEMRCAEII